MNEHRAYVGPPEYYDIIGGLQLVVLMNVGLREHHKVLDVGCGSLRGGRFIMQYLLPGNYYGIEPNKWLVEAAIDNEIGQDMIDLKRPHFSANKHMELDEWGVQFDYIMAQSIITHAPLAMVRQLMQAVYQVLSPEGTFIATVFEGDEDNQLTEWSYPAGVKWTSETIIELAIAAGLSVATLPFEHPAGQLWLAMEKDKI